MRNKEDECSWSKEHEYSHQELTQEQHSTNFGGSRNTSVRRFEVEAPGLRLSEIHLEDRCMFALYISEKKTKVFSVNQRVSIL